MEKNIIVVDVDRCIGCKGCQVACKQENGVALGDSRVTISQIGPVGNYPDLQMHFLPVMCQQCENPPCALVCPTGACYKNDEDGIIYIDTDMCIGCKSCMRACPYEINLFNKEMKVVDKCNLCEHLREEGEKPACVKNCPGSALIFGDINDPESSVSMALKEAGEDNVFSLRNKDNDPRVRYIYRNGNWIDILPQEVKEQRGGK